MERIIWEIQYISPPPAMRHCKKCGVKTEYHSTGNFRINGQNKHLDVWLIYKCSWCNTTWNLTLYSRINPKAIDPAVLHRLTENDSSLALQVACDTGLLTRNGARPGLPEFEITGNEIPPDVPVRLEIRSLYPLPVKVSSLLRVKMGLSHKAFDCLADSGQIRSAAGLDLKKCKLQKEITILITVQPNI